MQYMSKVSAEVRTRFVVLTILLWWPLSFVCITDGWCRLERSERTNNDTIVHSDTRTADDGFWLRVTDGHERKRPPISLVNDFPYQFGEIQREILLYCELERSLLRAFAHYEGDLADRIFRQASDNLILLRDSIHLNRMRLYDQSCKTIYRKILKNLNDLDFLLSLSLADYYQERCLDYLGNIQKIYLKLLCSVFHEDKPVSLDTVHQKAQQLVALCITDIYRWSDRSRVLWWRHIGHPDLEREQFFSKVLPLIRIDIDRDDGYLVHMSGTIHDKATMETPLILCSLTITRKGKIHNLSLYQPSSDEKYAQVND